MVFIAVGLVLGPFGLGFVRLNLGAQGLRTLAELTLAMVLFTDAANTIGTSSGATSGSLKDCS